MLAQPCRVIGIFLVVALSLASLALRWHDITNRVGAQNVEATYHVLHTISSLHESTWRHHFLLPTVTLGRDLDKGVKWGAAVPTATGDYIYTSFPPLDFLAPYAVLSLFGADTTYQNLAIFNFFLGAITSIILFLLIFEISTLLGQGQLTSLTIAVASTLISIFSREALHSHGVVYWSHSLYQPILAASILFLYHFVVTNKEKYKYLFLITIFIGPMVEWTSYIYSVGVIIALWFGFFRDEDRRRTDRRLALGAAIATFTSGLLVFLHFMLALGFVPALTAFAKRFYVRSGKGVHAADLVSAYGLSYGLFILIIGAILLAIYMIYVRGDKDGHINSKIVGSMLFVSTFPFLENIAMMQHATEFSFDRLKFVFSAALILAISMCYFGIVVRVVTIVFLVLASASGIKDYMANVAERRDWADIDRSNQKIADSVLARIDRSCTVFSASTSVRGYANLLFHAGINEWTRLEDAAAPLERQGVCNSVFIDADFAFTDLVSIHRVVILDRQGHTTVIE